MFSALPTQNNYQFSNHLPSGMRLQLYCTRKFYEWVDPKNELCSCNVAKFGKYLLAVPFHVGMLALTPLTFALDIIMTVCYLINLAFDCFELNQSKENNMKVKLAVMQCFAVIGIAIYTIDNLVGLIYPPLANAINLKSTNSPPPKEKTDSEETPPPIV